jgi:hypothetical protein
MFGIASILAGMFGIAASLLACLGSPASLLALPLLLTKGEQARYSRENQRVGFHIPG